MILKDIKKERKHSDDTINKMHDMIKEGKSYRTVGRAFSLSGGTIYNLVHKWCNTYKPDDKLPPKDFVCLKEYCMIHNINYNTLYYHIRNNNIDTVMYHNMRYIHIDTKLQNNKFLSSEKIEQILELYNAGFNKTNISKLLGVSRNTVSYYIEA